MYHTKNIKLPDWEVRDDDEREKSPGLTLLEAVSLTYKDKPFKQKNYVKNAQRRNKNLNQVHGVEREAEKQARAAAEEAGVPYNPRGIPNWCSMTTPPTLLPHKKYCDITGLPAKYTDPKTKLHYCTKEVFEEIRQLTPAMVTAYLSLRGQAAAVIA